MEFQDILYEKKDGVAKITINRPQSLNTFTGDSMYEMLQALSDAWYNKNISVVVLTGADDKASCTGGSYPGRTAATIRIN